MFSITSDSINHLPLVYENTRSVFEVFPAQKYEIAKQTINIRRVCAVPLGKKNQRSGGKGISKPFDRASSCSVEKNLKMGFSSRAIAVKGILSSFSALIEANTLRGMASSCFEEIAES